jgi:hypothetical protein
MLSPPQSPRSAAAALIGRSHPLAGFTDGSSDDGGSGSDAGGAGGGPAPAAAADAAGDQLSQEDEALASFGVVSALATAPSPAFSYAPAIVVLPSAFGGGGGGALR